MGDAKRREIQRLASQGPEALYPSYLKRRKMFSIVKDKRKEVIKELPNVVTAFDDGGGKPESKEQDPAKITNMERFVRTSMHTLLTYLDNPKQYVNHRSSQGISEGGEVTVKVKDLLAYVEYLPHEIQDYYRNYIERILNYNGHSLMLQSDKGYDPKKLAQLFTPIAEPTILADDATGPDGAEDGITDL
ncbi:hypothetical protein AAMO2058_001613900 [Amorphochlora amoebiformis]|uniref:Uncharacterized protein n=1 Tax=Amorphochlora amoebiformis TaxID=1561963 RepID=A0A7S0CYY8_9EUKA|mmetsp:Transcript_15045/g.23828  ORF Transcript_15045/g.23828 Transcript_15045/m.23828 type:complete len:189 (+) Transcript_15045:28-594(+)